MVIDNNGNGPAGNTPLAGRVLGADNRDVFCALLGLSEAEYELHISHGVIQRPG